jgi:hypothetical protein
MIRPHGNRPALPTLDGKRMHIRDTKVLFRVIRQFGRNLVQGR